MDTSTIKKLSSENLKTVVTSFTSYPIFQVGQHVVCCGVYFSNAADQAQNTDHLLIFEPKNAELSEELLLPRNVAIRISLILNNNAGKGKLTIGYY